MRMLSTLTFACAFQCLDQRGSVKFTGQMHRTLTIDRIPGRRIRNTEILHFKSDSDRGFFDGQTFNTLRRLPGRFAGCPANYFNAVDMTLGNLYGKLRHAKHVSIITQADLPGETASCGRRQDTLDAQLFPGSHHRDLFVTAKCGKIMG
jgi:hypothetical protein